MLRSRRAWSLLLGAALLCAYPWLRGQVIDPPLRPPPPRADRLRVVSWNLRNFAGDPAEHDLRRLADHLHAMQPQVVAFQEVLDPTALPPLLPGWRWHASRGGGRHDQHLVIGWDPTRVQLLAPLEHEGLGLEGRVRPGLSAYLQGPDGEGFHLVVVHLKATAAGLPDRREQWPRLVEAVRRRQATGPRDDDVLVVGDFNVAGGPSTTATEEAEQLARVLAGVGLSGWASVGGCTAYWDGARRDGWWEPSRLDLVWSHGFGRLPAAQRLAWPGTHCARYRCDPLHATEHHPEPDLHSLSDHCPTMIDLPWSIPARPS